MAMGKDDVTGGNYECESGSGNSLPNDFMRDFMDLDEFLAVTTAGSSDEMLGELSNGESNLCSGLLNAGRVTINEGEHNNSDQESSMQEILPNNQVDNAADFNEASRNVNLNEGAKALRTVSRQRNSASVGRKSSRPSLEKESNKDKKYWDRRVKNNIAAKRSRDAKRRKEMGVIERWKFLEGENERLKKEISNMKEQTEKLQKEIGQEQERGVQ